MTICCASFGDPAYSDDHSDDSIYGNLYNYAALTPAHNAYRKTHQHESFRFYRFSIQYGNSEFFGTVMAYSKEHALMAVQECIKDKAGIDDIPEEIIITVTNCTVENYVGQNFFIFFDANSPTKSKACN